MPMIILEDDGGDTVVCPYCGTGFSIEWDTEYGDPVCGSHDVQCTNYKCAKEFTVDVNSYTVYRSFKAE